MELWGIFLALAVLCAVIGFIRSNVKRVEPSSQRGESPQGGVMASDIEIPAAWDERAIGRQLTAIQSRPALVSYYIDALRQRFILKIEDRVAQDRTRFLRTHIEHLELGKQYQGLVNDLKAMEAEQENRVLGLTLQTRELKGKHGELDALGKLRLQKEQLAIEVEIEQLKAQKAAVGKPVPEAKPEPRLSPEQQRRLKRMEIEDQLQKLDRDEDEAIRNARGQEDSVRIRNMYADRREELREQLSKYLV